MKILSINSLLVWGVALTTLGVTPIAWALRDPDIESKTEGQAQGTTQVLRRYKQPLPPGGFQREEILQEELTGWPQTESQVVTGVRQYLQAHPEWIGGLSLNLLALHYTSTIPAQGTRPPMITVQFVQTAEGRVVEGSLASFRVKRLPGRSVLMAGSVRLFPDLILPSGTSQQINTMQAAGSALGLDMAQATITVNINRIFPSSHHLNIPQGHWSWSVDAAEGSNMIRLRPVPISTS